jgi:hypothetical protein
MVWKWFGWLEMLDTNAFIIGGLSKNSAKSSMLNHFASRERKNLACHPEHSEGPERKN